MDRNGTLIENSSNDAFESCLSIKHEIEQVQFKTNKEIVNNTDWKHI